MHPIEKPSWNLTNRAAPEDTEFVRALESFEIEPSDFSHRSHLQMAYTYLCEHSTETTCAHVRHVLCSVLSHNGIEPSAKYHETLTRVWALIVCHSMGSTPNTCSAAEFIDANPRLLDSELVLTHYTKDLLFSDAARSSFVKPDRAPIPDYAHGRV